MENYNFILDANIYIEIFEAGIDYNTFFNLVSEAFKNKGINTNFLSGNFIITDILSKFHDVKNQVKTLIKKEVIQSIDVDRDSQMWKSIASRAHEGNGYNPFINPSNDPYDIDCLYLQDKLKTNCKAIILTSDSGIEAYVRSKNLLSLDLVGLSCTSKALLGNEHVQRDILEKIEKTSALKHEGYFKSQQRSHVLEKRYLSATRFLSDLIAHFRIRPKRLKSGIQQRLLRRAPIFENNVNSADCPKYDPIVASDGADCFLCFNQRLSRICPNLEEFPGIKKGKISAE